MTFIGWIQILLYCAIVVALVKQLGGYMTRVFDGERTFLSPALRPVEAALYGISGVDEKREQHWLTYTVAMLLFHVGGFLILYALLRLQGLTHQNFLSAATGIVLAMALIRGFARASMQTVGNFWVDVTRCTLYILIPICVVYALFLVWEGMPQTLGPYVEATTLEG